MSLDLARTAHAAAKQAFADNPTSANTDALTAAAEAVQAAEALQARESATERAKTERAFADYQGAEAERQALIGRTRARLVELEREAHAAIALIESTTRDSINAYQGAKRLSLSLDLDATLKPPLTMNAHMHQVQYDIGSAQLAEGRNGRDGGAASAWLEPAFVWSGKRSA